jgi:hypothetical protein
LVTEAFSIPFICRSKQQLKLVLEGADPSSVLSVDGDNAQQSKRGSKPPPALATSSTLLIADPVVYTSDEEKSNPSRLGAVVRYPFAMSDLVAAPVPKSMWPVEKIPFPPLILLNNPPLPPPTHTPSPAHAHPGGQATQRPQSAGRAAPLNNNTSNGSVGSGSLLTHPAGKLAQSSQQQQQYRRPSNTIGSVVGPGGNINRPVVSGISAAQYGALNIQHSVKLPANTQLRPVAHQPVNVPAAAVQLTVPAVATPSSSTGVTATVALSGATIAVAPVVTPVMVQPGPAPVRETADGASAVSELPSVKRSRIEDIV